MSEDDIDLLRVHSRVMDAAEQDRQLARERQRPRGRIVAAIRLLEQHLVGSFPDGLRGVDVLAKRLSGYVVPSRGARVTRNHYALVLPARVPRLCFAKLTPDGHIVLPFNDADVRPEDFDAFVVKAHEAIHRHLVACLDRGVQYEAAGGRAEALLRALDPHVRAATDPRGSVDSPRRR